MSWLSRAKVFSLLAIFIFSCSHDENSVHKFYDIDSLVSKQISQLAQLKPTVVKEARINKSEEVSTITIGDTLLWKKELDVFRQLDLNKGINVDNYKIDEGIADNASNLTITEYTSKNDLPVVYLKIYYQDKVEDIRRIQGLFHEDNSLYTSKRYFSMELTKVGTETVIVSYSISGGQKMILGDSVKYSIKGILTYPEK
jgi:hypothetical protein